MCISPMVIMDVQRLAIPNAIVIKTGKCKCMDLRVEYDRRDNARDRERMITEIKFYY